MQLDTLTIIGFISALLLTITAIATAYARVQDARNVRAEKLADSVMERANQDRTEQFGDIKQVLSAVASSVSQVAATAQSQAEVLKELGAYVAEQRIRDRLRTEGQQAEDRRKDAPA
jgi:predicted membrane chloride channel (bestrophin family)